MKDLVTFEMVMEAATEHLEVRKDVLWQLHNVCDKSAILATYTPSASVTHIVSVTSGQDKVLGLNRPVGPLTLTDSIGFETLCFLACSAYEDTDSMWLPPVLLQRMVTPGRHGRKTGRGFCGCS